MAGQTRSKGASVFNFSYLRDPGSDPAPLLPGLAAVMWLAQYSPLHQRYPTGRLLRRVLPSLELNQYRSYSLKGRPIGFVNWAWLDDVTSARFAQGDYDLLPHEWQGGKNLWFPEILAPFGHGTDIMLDLRTQFPEGTTARAVYVNPDGSFRRVQKFR